MIDTFVADPSFQAFLDTLSQTLSDMLPRLQPVVSNFNDMMIRLLPGLNPLIDILGGLLETVSIGLGTSAENSGEMFGAFEDLAFIIANVNSGLRDWNSFIDDITIDMGAMGPVVTGILKAIESALNPVKSGLDAIANLIRWINGTPVKNFQGNANLTVRGAGTQRPFADGGIVMKPISNALVGEAGPEAIIPLSKFDDVVGKRGGGNVNIVVNAGMGTDGAAVGEQIVNAIRRYERTSGAVFAKV
jgi:hypothetical protein